MRNKRIRRVGTEYQPVESCRGKAKAGTPETRSPVSAARCISAKPNLRLAACGSKDGDASSAKARRHQQRPGAVEPRAYVKNRDVCRVLWHSSKLYMSKSLLLSCTTGREGLPPPNLLVRFSSLSTNSSASSHILHAILQHYASSSARPPRPQGL